MTATSHQYLFWFAGSGACWCSAATRCATSSSCWTCSSPWCQTRIRSSLTDQIWNGSLQEVNNSTWVDNSPYTSFQSIGHTWQCDQSVCVKSSPTLFEKFPKYRLGRFHKKSDVFAAEIVLGQNGLQKVAQMTINHPIWSHSSPASSSCNYYRVKTVNFEFRQTLDLVLWRGVDRPASLQPGPHREVVHQDRVLQKEENNQSNWRRKESGRTKISWVRHCALLVAE